MMNIVDIILIAVIAAVVILAARRVILDRRSGKSCSCGCESCGKNCPMRNGDNKIQ